MIWFLVVCLSVNFCNGDDVGPFFETHYHKRSINEATFFATTVDPSEFKAQNQMLLILGGVKTNSKGGYDYINQFVGFDGLTWVPKSSPPSKERFATLSPGPDGKVIAAGGADYSNNNTYLYDIAEDRWEPGPALNTPRSGHFSVSLGSKVYILGGNDASHGNDLHSVEVWDLGKGKSSKWEFMPPMSTARFGLSATVYKGDLYVVGGWDLKTAEKYVFLLKTWKDVPSMIHARYVPSLVTFNDKIYAIGGYDPKNRIMLKSVESFNGKKWVEEAPLIEGRHGASTGVMDGKIYVVGGATYKAELVYDVEVYDPSTSKWSLVDTDGTSPLPIFQNGATVVDLP